MRIELDENLPHSLVQRLSQMGHDVDTVPDEGLAGKDDGEVWAATQAAGRFLITQGLDFSDERKYTPGAHAGVLLVRLPQPLCCQRVDAIRIPPSPPNTPPAERLDAPIYMNARRTENLTEDRVPAS